VKSFYYRVFGNPRSYKKDLKYVNGCSRILDVGCGHGYFAENDIQRIIGVDSNPESVRACQRKNITCFQTNVLSLPFKDDEFDGVYCAHLIEHFSLDDVQTLLSELDRVLKLNGVLVIKTPMPNKFFYDDPTHVRPYPPAALLPLVGLSTDGQHFIKSNSLGYGFIKMYFSRRLLFQPDLAPVVAPNKYFFSAGFKAFGMLLGRMGVRHWEKSEYTLILQKKRSS
jgi:SAM-dependent methyltransferase